MSGRRTALFSTAALLLAAAGLAGGRGGEVSARGVAHKTVERIRYIGTVSYSRVVIDLSAPVEYRMESVPSRGESVPNRLVIDVADATVGPEAREPLSVRDAMLRGIRTGQYTADTARIVLDLTASADSRIFVLPDPYRLVIDLNRRGAPLGEDASRIRRMDSGQGVVENRAREGGDARPASASSRATARSEPADSRTSRAPRPPREPEAEPSAGKRLRVMIDPGHGGKDPGAVGVGGLEEKDVVLSIAKLLAARLGADSGIEVGMTRSDDRFLSLEERTGLANAAGADLFVSVHANASLNPSSRGVEVYYLNNTNNRGTLRLAAMENNLRWDPHNPRLQAAIPDLSYILSDLRQTYKVEESRQLAEQLQQSVVGRLGDSYDSIDDLGVKEGPFYVLVGAYMPCVLVEVSFLTNPTEGSRLASQTYRRALADGIYDGIHRYLAQTKLAKTL